MYCSQCGTHKADTARYCDVCGERLTSQLRTVRAPASGGETLLGVTLDGVYRLDSIISRGVTSIVYRGVNVRLGQQVAVKVLAAPLATDESLMVRFEAEARVQARLRHPGIVSVQDFVSADDVYAIVMEHFEGPTLSQVLYDLDGPMPPRRIRSILLPILDALSYAHEQSVIHRDIKPSNILLARVGGREFPKVMDFGIAKVLAQSASESAPSGMLGTLLYMSPEQCKALKTLDERSDIYSLGVTLYQMATGMVPFYADSAFDIMMGHVQTPPPPPRSLAHEVPAALEAVILRALEKDPDLRFTDAPEFKAALEDAIELTDPWGTEQSRHTSWGQPAAPGAAAQAGTRARPRPSGLVEQEVRRTAQAALEDAGHFPQHYFNQVAEGAEGPRGTLPPRAFREAEDRQPSPPGDMPASDELGGDGVRAEEGAATPSPRSRPPTGPLQPADAAKWQAQGDEAHYLGAEPNFDGDWNDKKTARLRLSVSSAEDWSHYFAHNVFGGGIFCPTQTPPEVGTRVRVEFTFVGGPRFLIRGIVTWRRPPTRDPRMKAGAGIQVHPRERGKIAFVNAWVRGSVNDQRSNRRLPIRLRVTYSARTGRRMNFTRDIQETGLFIRSQELLDVGTPIRVVLMAPFPGQNPFDLRGRVARRVEQHDERGMGISLEFASDAARQRFADFVGDLGQKLSAGQLPDEAVY